MESIKTILLGIAVILFGISLTVVLPFFGMGFGVLGLVIALMGYGQKAEKTDDNM